MYKVEHLSNTGGRNGGYQRQSSADLDVVQSYTNWLSLHTRGKKFVHRNMVMALSLWSTLSGG
jgi:hypothetical protein